MKLRARAASLFAGALLLGGCYNNPDITARHPGEGPVNIHARPAVGPGTVPGGSTAGKQPPAKVEEGHATVEPTHSGMRSDPKGPEHMGASEPGAPHDTAAPKGPASTTGNEAARPGTPKH